MVPTCRGGIISDYNLALCMLAYIVKEHCKFTMHLENLVKVSFPAGRRFLFARTTVSNMKSY
jgi:hypothetical protein